MRKSDIRYPRATSDPRPAEGHIATENIKCQISGEHAQWKDVAYMALPYQRLPLPEKEFHFHQESWLARLTTLLWLFSLTASIAYWLPGMGRSIMWRALSWSICFCKYKDLSTSSAQIKVFIFFLSAWYLRSWIWFSLMQEPSSWCHKEIGTYICPILNNVHTNNMHSIHSVLISPYASQGLKYPLKSVVSICLPVHLLVCNAKINLYLHIRNGVRLSSKFIWKLSLTLSLLPLSRAFSLFLQSWKERLNESESDFVMPFLSYISKMWPLS